MEASTLVSMKHLFPDWYKCLLEDSKFEASQFQMKLLQEEGRNAVWETCKWFGCEARGVAGQACRLLERYLFTVLHDVNELQSRVSLQTQIPLLIAACVSLASKMNNSASPIAAKVIHIVFLCNRISCTVDDIIANELKVYRTLGFRIPLWTSVEIGEMLALEIGFPPKLMDNVAKLIDVAEHRRHRINKKVSWIILLPSPSTIGVLTLHLTAGAVAAAARLFHQDLPDAVPRLAVLTKAPQMYIKCIKDVICAEITTDSPQIKMRAVKRK